MLNGARGNDLLIGRGGADTFVFTTNFGRDEIRGFSANDAERIDLSGILGGIGAVPQIVDFFDLVSNHLSSGADGSAVISVGNNTITLTGWSVADFGEHASISAADFIF